MMGLRLCIRMQKCTDAGLRRTIPGTGAADDGRLIPLEVKLSATPNPRMAQGIRRLREDLGSRAAGGYAVHPGDVELPLGDGGVALPFARL